MESREKVEKSRGAICGLIEHKGQGYGLMKDTMTFHCERSVYQPVSASIRRP